jgi:hypothetical protein
MHAALVAASEALRGLNGNRFQKEKTQKEGFSSWGNKFFFND